MAALDETIGAVDILVNNVGVFGLADFTSISDAEWARYFDVNVLSGVRLSRFALTGMLDRGWGRIVSSRASPASTFPRT